jgi:large subunit ribosomal protein L4
MIRLALFSALSDRASEARVLVVDQWAFEAPSTKEAVAFLEAIEVSGRVLVVLGEMDGFAERSFANLRDVQTLVARELNAYDILVNDWVIFTDETLPGGASVVAEAAEAGDETAGDESAEEDAS